MPTRGQAIIITNDGLVYWCIYVSFGLDKSSHSGRMTHKCVGQQTTIGSDNGLSPGWHQAIIWTNAKILIGPLGINFCEILIKIHFHSIKCIWKCCQEIGSHFILASMCLPIQWWPHSLMDICITIPQFPNFNSSPPGQNGRHFPDDIFRCIFLWKVWYFDWNFTEVCS